MAITANISLNNAIIVLTNPPKYQLYFNFSAQSSFDITHYIQYIDGAPLNINPVYTLPTPTKSYSDLTNPFYADGIGWHLVEIEVFNTNGESIRVSQRIYLDLTNPVLNNFALNRVDRNTSNDYVVNFDIDISDDSGISRTKIINITDGTSSEVMVPLSTNDYRAIQTIVVPGSNNNVTKQFILEYADYSGNQVSTSVPIDVFFTNTPPVVTSVKVNHITQTANDYIITAEILASFANYQNIAAYSLRYENPNPSWVNTFATGTSATFVDTLIVPKTEPAGTKTIYASLKDNYNNVSAVGSVTFELDKLKPFGAINLDYAEKIGSNYYANLHFTATDSGLVAAYSYNTISPTIAYWNLINPPTQTFDKNLVLNLGPSGQKDLYVQYRDFSGNLSDVYNLPIDIDTINPDCNFDFNHGELRTDGDYNAYFNLIGVDNASIDFIKLYGVNSNTGNIVSGQSNTWIRIPSSGQSYNELRPIVIPSTEHENNITFYFQVRDLFGNDSPIRTTNVHFDKTPPVMTSLTYNDVIKTATKYRIYADFTATDDRGLVAYRYGFDDITIQDWEYVTKATSLSETVYLEVPITEIGVAKSFLVQVKDVFGNMSNVLSIPILVDTQPPIGTIQFVGGGLTPTDFTLDFQIDATDPNNDVFWYSLEVDDPTITNWKKLNTPGLTVSEVKQMLLPRTSSGRHSFYLKFADVYKNESPIYNLEYDLDAINTIGGLSLHDIEKTPSTYNANVALYAFDNRKVKSYIIDGGTETAILPPIQNFNDYIVLPIGLSAGPKTITVQYKDTFDNLSDVYTLNFDLDNTDPFANIYFTGATSDPNNFYLNFDLNMYDDQSLYEYKFWYLGNSEPYAWSTVPIGQTTFTVNETFKVPNTDSFPGFKWKVRDFFENEYQNTEYKTITSVPPTINSLNVSNIAFSQFGSNVEVSYDITADTGSTVNKLEVIVNEVGVANLDFFEVDVEPNVLNANNKFYYLFDPSISSGSFKVRAFSDYGYPSNYTTTTNIFDNVKPIITSATHLGSFTDNSDYIIQFRLQGTDSDSGIRKIKAVTTTNPFPTTTTYTIDLNNVIDETVNIRVDRAHLTNLIDVTFTLIDLLGNESLPTTISNIFLDIDGPTITNIVFNQGKTYNSAIAGANTNIIDISFDSTDASDITHYKYSKNITESFNNTWLAASPNSPSISISDTVNLNTLGFIEGMNIFYIHVKDKFGNISTAGVQFEYDKTPPNFTTTFANYTERRVIGTKEYFVLPYYINYSDNYSEVQHVHANHIYIGNPSLITTTNINPPLQSNTAHLEEYLLQVGFYGDTEIVTVLEDRFENQTANTSFNVYLENIPPVINSTVINNGALYTTTKDVYVRMDLVDDSALSASLFSNTANVVWNTPGWTPIPYTPTTSITSSFLIDLEAIGFEQGVCNVYCHIKDFCQNMTTDMKSIIYDYEPPVIVDFKVNSIVRSINTFDIELNALAYDVTSGLDTYYISNYSSNKVYDNVPGAPLVGNTPILFTETKQVSVKDNGWKDFFFQATDAAGNVSLQANTRVYIDGLAPVASYFQPTSTISKKYLNNANRGFEYIVADDYALESIEYQIDSQLPVSVKQYNPANNVTYDANTFTPNFAGLSDGEHTIYLTVLDSFENRVRVPYEFFYDNRNPIISKFEIKEVRPVGNTTYDVEFDLSAYDNVGISYYELFDNQTLIATDSINDVAVMKTPTVKNQLTDVFDSNLNIYLVLIEDSLGTTISNAYALVQNYTGTAAEDSQIQSFLQHIIGVPLNEMNMFIPLGNNIDVVQQTGGSLTAEVSGLDLNQFPTNYEVFQFYSATGTTTVPTSTIATYIKNNFVYTVSDPAVNEFIEYKSVWLTDVYSNVSVHKELHEYELKVHDYAGNVGSKKISKYIHDGTNLQITSFYVDGSTSINRTSVTTENFDLEVSSDVNLIQYALTIHPSLDFYSGLWNDFVTPNTTIIQTETLSLDNFAISSLSSNSVYLHVKDDSGNVANTSVDIILTSNNPVIKGLNSPVTMRKQGNYYIGELVFDIQDPNSQIEAYAIGFTPNPTNYKSIALTSATTLTQQFKIPESEINGSQLVYIRLRDSEGNESLTYRLSIRILDFEFDTLKIEPDEYMAGNGNVRVTYDTDSNPTEIEYGYRIDNNNEPTSWNPITLLNQNDIGEYYFDFNIDVSSISIGKHDIYVWLKSREGDKVFEINSFVSEQSAVAPYATLSIYKTKIEEGKKRVWVEANVFDAGVGVKQICFDENSNPDVFDNINIVQNKRILKLFEYDVTDNSSITYKLKLIDAVNTPSLTYNTTVDLTYVY